jgi:hypothetical protein
MVNLSGLGTMIPDMFCYIQPCLFYRLYMAVPGSHLPEKPRTKLQLLGSLIDEAFPFTHVQRRIEFEQKRRKMLPHFCSVRRTFAVRLATAICFRLVRGTSLRNTLPDAPMP